MVGCLFLVSSPFHFSALKIDDELPENGMGLRHFPFFPILGHATNTNLNELVSQTHPPT
jgi:hypothetical protein